jgi:dienelactone hydrolase
MFDYFPNYVWNLSVSIAMASGAELGEIMDMCQPLLAEAEDYGMPIFDYLAGRDDMDAARIGITGISLGGAMCRASLRMNRAMPLAPFGARTTIGP